MSGFGSQQEYLLQAFPSNSCSPYFSEPETQEYDPAYLCGLWQAPWRIQNPAYPSAWLWHNHQRRESVPPDAQYGTSENVHRKTETWPLPHRYWGMQKPSAAAVYSERPKSCLGQRHHLSQGRQSMVLALRDHRPVFQEGGCLASIQPDRCSSCYGGFP